MLRTLMLLPLLALNLTAADMKPRDMCAPPPGAVAPSLPAKIMEGQGSVHFAITTSSAEAQRFFDQGVNQMHSFWAVEAERSFLQAAALDADAPMPWWGVAMVAAGDYRPRHQLERDGKSVKPASKPAPAEQRAIDAAAKAVRLSQVPGKATELEKMYIAAVAARRSAPPATRDDAYIAALRAILAAHPDEVEAGSYLALHLMRGFTLPDHQPREGSMEAVALLRQLAIKFPDHPGVHHYIIHGFEGATFAKDAWPSCRRYPQLVTNIPHALHMPGHIWAQTGEWAQAEAAFQAAAQNELGYLRADALFPTGHHGHNVAFLTVTYDFEGKYQQAMDAAKSLMAFGENPREKATVDNTFAIYRQGWFGVLRTLVFFEKWDGILDGKTLPVYDKPREQAWRHWALGLALAHRGGHEAAKSELRLMETAMKSLAQATGDPVPPALEVGRKELEGQIALAHNTGKGLRQMQEAAVTERALRYTEPPSYPRPVYAALAAEARRAHKADVEETALNQLLQQYPGYPEALRALRELRRDNAGAVARK